MIGGHKTGVSLEDPFWNNLKDIAHAKRLTLPELVAQIDGARKQSIYPRRSACLCLSTSKMKTSDWK